MNVTLDAASATAMKKASLLPKSYDKETGAFEAEDWPELLEKLVDPKSKLSLSQTYYEADRLHLIVRPA